MNHLIPKYYEKFKCIGSDCPETCCQGWKVSIDKDTFNKYQKLDNTKLKDKASKFLKKYPQHDLSPHKVKGFYGYITMNKGTCPFLGQDKLCSVQKEYGNSFYPQHVHTFLENEYLKIKS